MYNNVQLMSFRSGYSLQLDGKMCADVDECKENPRICNGGKCTNTLGSYNCHCTDGLITASGGAGCIGTRTNKNNRFGTICYL